MADNRFNQAPGFGGSAGFHIGQQGPSMNGMPNMAAYMPGGMPVSPMMQQQMMMASRMRPPMQGMMMGVPATPPPPYSMHVPNPGATSIPNRPRTLLSKSKEGQQSEKERYFEEQRQKLRLFGKPGTVKVDADKLIGTMFAADVKTQHSKAKSKNNELSQDEDDGFGDFLQGPSVPTKTGQKDNQSAPQLPQAADVVTTPEPKLESSLEKKDLKSMMLEYSDLSAPKKAKGFHKLTLNEVHKSGHSHHKVTNFHESDHSRSWKQNTEDLEGLFHVPVTPKPAPLPVNPVSPESPHLAYTPQQVMAAGLSPTGMPAFTPGYQVLAPPSGQPPSYNDIIGGAALPNSHAAMFAGHAAVSPPGSSDLGHSPSARPLQLPSWCSQEEDQLPPVYKQVYEASLVDGKVSTERVYPILLLSGLPREKLAQIWSLCNTATPGQLTKYELWLVLALIALTQNNYDSSSQDILARCPVAPVPFFAQMQDPSGPATLPVGPQQHQPTPPHHSAATLATSHTPAHVALPSRTPHQKPQFHRVQHSKPLPHKASHQAPADGAPPKSAGPTEEDDDFADFQAAAPTTNTAAVGKDEVFGEFIGGGVGSSGFSLLCPVAGPVHMGNGSVVMGNGSLHHQPNQQQLRQPQEAQQQPEPAPLLLASLPVDDKYGTNVRSFFCSSDSSTGHTSPSFEDDDFTDGRDSLSQVSTSEQSENEDIRNFENYVEEYNQQMEKPSASPLHCPFPALQQSQPVAGAKRNTQPPSNHAQVDDTKHSTVKTGALSKFDLNAAALDQIPGSKNTNFHAGLNYIGQNPASTDFENAVSSLKMTSATPVVGNSLRSIKELADSKSVSLRAAPLPDIPASNELLIGDEDKYSALRVLSFDSDLSSQHPTLKDPGHVPGFSATSSLNNHESNLAKSPESQDDDWADFSAAPPAADDQMNPVSTVPSVREVGAISDLEASTGSLFEDDSSYSPSKGWSLSLPASGDGLSFKRANEPDTSPTDGGGDGRYHRSDYSEPVSSVKTSNVTEVENLNFATNSAFAGRSFVAPSTGSDLVGKLKYEDNWGQFPHNVSATNSFSLGVSSQGLAAREVVNNITEDSSYSDVKATAEEEEDWCDFSSAGGTGDGAAGADDVEGGDSKGKFVTIKKQNLETNEIMGLFKVRDDPATLSSYQLPPQQQASKMASSQGQAGHQVGTSSLGRRRSSDFDDDLCPPPMDLSHDDDYDDHSYSRGYDLDDFMQRLPTTTAYNPFGGTHTSPLYSRPGGLSKLKESKEDTASVHSLDLPSSRPTNRSSSDSQSVSSADLTSAEMAGVGVVSVESKSLDSLDLKSDNGDGDSVDGGTREGVQTLGPASHPQPIQPQELLATMPDFADRYNIEREAQGSDRYGYEWERCLSNCCRMISEANMLFNMIDSSSVCNEVLKSSQGSEYVMCIIEVYRVVCRVLTSMRVTAISTTELEQTLKNIDIAWNNLSAFLVGTSLLPEQTSLVFTNCVPKSDTEPAHSVACGLCLLNVDARPSGFSSQPGTASAISSCKLTYAGRQYHATCANFWVNCVDQTLPSLTLSALL